MIEFVSLCVCSACLSCICCMITGGLCVTRAGCKLRNKLACNNHFSDDIRWLGYLPPSEYFTESDGSCGGSDVSPVAKILPRDKRSNCCCETSKEAVPDIDGTDNKSPQSGPSGRKEAAVNTVEKSNRPRRWTFCFGSRKSSDRNCPPFGKNEKEEKEKEKEKELELEDTKDFIPAEKAEQKSCSCKRRRKSGIRGEKNVARPQGAYFKSCSCTSVEERRKKRRVKKYRRSETPPAARSDTKRATKKTRKSIKKCPKNCRCKITTESKNTARRDHRTKEKCGCKCGGKN